jgi:hypothetical protein
MSYNKSLLAFDDVKPAFDRALEHPKGLRIKCETHAKAIVLRGRFNYFRGADRKENTKIYPNDHPLWNRSIYDKLILRVPKKGSEDENYVYLEKRSVDNFEIEDLIDM